jgi:NAD(P)-dependent dehydrogenase (short-subunit alcohol dehydrogenase family)
METSEQKTSDQCRGRVAVVTDAGGGIGREHALQCAEGWHRGPNVDPCNDPTQIGSALRDRATRVGRNAGMRGADLD